MVSFKLEPDAALSNAEKQLLKEAKNRPGVYDEDSPELTPAMEEAFVAARKAKPYKVEPLTVYVSPATIEKAKSIKGDYMEVLGRLLDKAVNEYVLMKI